MIRLMIALMMLVAPLMPAEAQRRGPLVLAAASLQESLTVAADAWTRQGHDRPVLSFAASSALARQVRAGAPADLFVSADAEWMDVLAKAGLIRTGTRANLAGNRLVLVAPAGSRVTLPIRRGFAIARVIGSRRLAMADPDAVPAGRYGRAALTALGEWPAVAGRIARAENVRAALALVERGEAPLGIVYATDARASRKVRLVGVFPAASHPAIVYPVTVLRAARHPEADAFRRFLLSRRGRAVFARFGFTGG